MQENKLRISLPEESIGIEGRGANSKTADNDNSNSNSSSTQTDYVNANKNNNNSAANTRKTLSKEMEEDIEVLINIFKLNAVNLFTKPIIVLIYPQNQSSF